ncbi:DinB family protein [Thalassolituus sp. LLYu03]|uniref:DinB family protein n=1 Tax=Thalassolituus sp. LLYu03 TaxID=3421656 RepID=UPI003D2E80C3
MPWSDHYRRYARYNQWVNNNLLDVCATLPDGRLSEPTGLFFGSLLGTWNHLLVTDLLWLKRLGQVSPLLEEELRDLPPPARLDQTLASSSDEIRALRQRLDDLLIRWCDLLRADEATDMVEYTNTRGEAMVKPLDLILQHLFNHQTHHRGQLTAELSRLGVDYGVTDLLYLPPD